MKRSVLFLLWAVTILSANALEVTIHGLNYFLDSKSHEAVITSGGTCSGELDIPSEVCYNGETFVVKSMIWKAFDGLVELTKVRIPKTLESIMHEYPQEPTYEDVELPYDFYPCTNPFTRCTSLESIEVDEENPGMKSVGGVLFSKDGTWLYAYPAGIKAASYDVPQGVTQVGTFALANENLKKVDLAESVQAVGLNICYDSSLDTLIIRGRNVEDMSMRGWFLRCLKETAKLYVPASEIDRYKSLYSGTVLPLEEYEGRKETQVYFPEGTKWTEIRLDTLKYDSWYSKVGDEWVPNFETIEYRVEGEYTDPINGVYNCVYTNGPEWTDSLALLIHEGLYSNSSVEVSVPYYYSDGCIMWPGEVYQFDWSIGKGLYYRDIQEANSTGAFPIMYFYGIIDEIKEGYFGGVRPLKYADLDGKAPDKSSKDWDFGYTDTDGGRVIQGIGITEWNGGECLFGPAKPYDVMTWSNDNRHYRSMLVHFERDGEVLYDVWPEKEAITKETVTFTKGQIATIILPIAPDASKGRYYRLDRWENKHLVFEEEPHPKARTPYIIVPNEDFNIELSTLDVNGLRYDTVRIKAVSPYDPTFMAQIRFVGTYATRSIDFYDNGYRYYTLDTTSDVFLDMKKPLLIVGAMRAYWEIMLDLCRDIDTLRYWDKLEYVLHNQDEETIVTYTAGQMATIVLPTEPDASKGKYYRLDRVEGNEIIFEQELQPRAHVPDIIVPHEDFSIEQSAMELDGLRSDTASVEGISFIGTYQKDEVESQEGFYIELIDTTPDCSLSGNKLTIGVLRAYLLVRWDDPYNHGGTKVPAEKMEIVLRDDPNSIQMVNGKSSNGKCYDLSGKLVSRKSLNRKLPRGIYIEEGRKVLER